MSQRALRGLHGVGEQHDLLAGLGEADGRVVDLARRPQHRVLVLLIELLESRVLHQHGVGQPAMVEHVPDEARARRAQVSALRRPGSGTWPTGPRDPSSEIDG